MALLPVQRPLNIVDFPQHSSLSAVSVPIICPSPLCVMCSASFPCRELLFTPKTLGKNYSITRSFPSPFSLSITFSFVPTGLLCLCWLAPITVLRLLGYKMWPPARQGLHPGHCCVLNSCVGPQTQKGLKKYFSDLISELEFFFFLKKMAYFFLSQDTTVRDEPSSSLTFQVELLVIPATNRENESEQVTSSKSYAGDSDSMSKNTKHLDTKFLCLFFFLASYADVSKHPDVLPDITQTTLCHILLNDLVPWRHSLHWVEISVKIELTAGTLTYSRSSRKDLWDVAQR